MADEYIPAVHVVPPPADGWKAADLSEDEYVDDAFIAATAARVYEPLMPEDEKLFPAKDA
ncbi:MAG TPA: hypothetical protein VF657_13220 [Actinoplanes sp.]|jgi:hypothetical protein